MVTRVGAGTSHYRNIDRPASLRYIHNCRADQTVDAGGTAAAQERRQYAARLVAVTRQGPRLARIAGAGGDRLLQLGEPGQMTLQRLAAFCGEPEPRVRPPADRAIADFHVPGVFEHAGLLRQHRVADPGRVTQRGELDPVRVGRQQPADRQPGDGVNERVRPGGHAVPPPPRRCSVTRAAKHTWGPESRLAFVQKCPQTSIAVLPGVELSVHGRELRGALYGLDLVGTCKSTYAPGWLICMLRWQLRRWNRALAKLPSIHPGGRIITLASSRDCHSFLTLM